MENLKVFGAILSLFLIMLFTMEAVYTQQIKQAPMYGRDVFLQVKCDNCHSVVSQQITSKSGSPKDLSDKLKGCTSLEISKYLTKDTTFNGKKHMIKFNGSTEQLDSLSTWLKDIQTLNNTLQ